MPIAKIKNAKVVQVDRTAADPTAEQVSDGWIAAPGDVVCGMSDEFSPPQSPNWSRDPLLNRVRAARCYALNAVTGILTRELTKPQNAAVRALIDDCLAAQQALLDMTKTPAVLATTNDAELTAALVTAYLAIQAAAPVAIQNAFAEMHL